MKEEFTYRSTPNGKAPSGYKKKGTFRDITLAGADPELIDQFDMDCQERGMTRWEFATNVLLAHPENGGDHKRFYDIFSKTRMFTSVVEMIGKETGLSEQRESAHNDLSR